MNSALDGLGVTAQNDPAQSANNNPTGAASQTPGAGLEEIAKDPATRNQLSVLHAIVAGQIPGVVVPKEAEKLDSKLTPQHITGLGLGIYRPKTPGLLFAVFNPHSVPESTLKALDAKGTLGTALPSLTALLKGATPEGGQSTASGQTPAGDEPSAITDMNLTGTPAPSDPTRVAVLPRGGMSADANKQLALRRAKAAAGNISPSARPTPGAGAVLNGLMQQVV
jgi:hypothetical protein